VTAADDRQQCARGREHHRSWEDPMTHEEHALAAATFRDLNRAGRFILPNAWDAASARVFEEAGFVAIGTTSGGIANSRGLEDGERISREAMLREIAGIVAAVRLGVTADIEAGYGDAPAAVAETVNDVLDLAVVGVNLEDRAHRSSDARLYSIDEHTARIVAARAVAERRGIHLVINARTDTFLVESSNRLEDRVSVTMERGRAYLQAGADLVFVPGLVDPQLVRQISDGIEGALSVMALPGAPAADVLFEAGARRVSIGTAAMVATLGALREIAYDILRTRTWTSMFVVRGGNHELRIDEPTNRRT
jgi:2-methylisocitrate lyase-like PEP mutase family enzyme